MRDRISSQTRCCAPRLAAARPRMTQAAPARPSRIRRSATQARETSRRRERRTCPRVSGEHPRGRPGRERLGPDHDRAIEEERTLRMATPDDSVDLVRQVVDVHFGLPVRAHALCPRGEPAVHVRLAPRARPEVAARVFRRRADLQQRPRPGVPREGREIREEVRERVVLVPDEPAAVEASVCLVVARAREAADAREAARACVNPDDPGEVGRVELREEPSPVARAGDRQDGRPPGERDDRARQDPVPGRRLRCTAPPRRRPVRRARGGAKNERAEHRQRANRHALSLGGAAAGHSSDLAARYRT